MLICHIYFLTYVVSARDLILALLLLKIDHSFVVDDGVPALTYLVVLIIELIGVRRALLVQFAHVVVHTIARSGGLILREFSILAYSDQVLVVSSVL